MNRLLTTYATLIKASHQTKGEERKAILESVKEDIREIEGFYHMLVATWAGPEHDLAIAGERIANLKRILRV